MTSPSTAFTATHVFYISPHGGPSMKPAHAFDITALVSSQPATKAFRSEADHAIKHTVNGANPPEPAFTSTKPSRFSSSSVLSTPSNPNLATINTPIINAFVATIKFTDTEFHPDITMRQALYTLRRSMNFVFNSRPYQWKWGLWAPLKLIMGEGGESAVVAMFDLRWGFQLAGVMAVDAERIHPSVAFATILVCLKRDRER